MIPRDLKALAAAGLLALGGAAQAALVTQSQTFDIQLGPSSTSPLDIPVGTFTATFSPFNASLGELTSFTLVWNLLATASMTVSADAGPAGNGLQLTNPGGTGVLSVGGFAYSGLGVGESSGGGPGDPVVVVDALLNTRLFPIPTNYDPNILATVTGPSPYAVLWNEGVRAITDNSNFSDLTSGVTGSVTMTYEYTPAAPVPLPGSLLLLLPGLGLLGARRARRQSNPGLR